MNEEIKHKCQFKTKLLNVRWESLKFGGHKEKTLWAQAQSHMNELIKQSKQIGDAERIYADQLAEFDELARKMDEVLPSPQY
jgi:hypothetical protein